MIDQGDTNVYGIGYGMNPMDAGVIPTYISPAGAGVSISRKRLRDSCSFDPSVLSFPESQFVNQSQLNDNNNNNNKNNNNISMQIYEQQVEIDRFVTQHTEKMRSEIENNRLRISTRLIAVAKEGMKRLRSKEDEINNIGKVNRALQEKVKSLTVDNQIWQQLAESNEATAAVLRRNLQQILSQIPHQQEQYDDGESCCGSNYDEKRTLAKARVNDEVAYFITSGDNNGSGVNRWCRNCGKGELRVVVLPCRHLCICTVCESSINVCPICKSAKNASLHVNMNSY